MKSTRTTFTKRIAK